MITVHDRSMILVLGSYKYESPMSLSRYSEYIMVKEDGSEKNIGGFS